MIQSIRIYSLCFAILLGLAAVAPAHAATPTDVLKQSIGKILNTLKEPAYKNPATRPPLRAQIENEVRTVFDFTEFSRRTVSSYWKNFTPDQQKRFSDAFSELLISTYLDKVDGYNGEQVQYLGERFTQNNQLAEVNTTITLSGGQVTPVAYRMRQRGDTWRIYDVLIENVGLNSNYRAQFNEILAKSTPDDLIRRVEERVQETHRQAAR